MKRYLIIPIVYLIIASAFCFESLSGLLKRLMEIAVKQRKHNEKIPDSTDSFPDNRFRFLL